MDGAASSRSHDNDGLRLPANTMARAGGQKKSFRTSSSSNRTCPPSDRPSLTECRDLVPLMPSLRWKSISNAFQNYSKVVLATRIVRLHHDDRSTRLQEIKVPINLWTSPSS